MVTLLVTFGGIDMKKLITTLTIGLSLGAMASGPLSPMEGYQTTDHSEVELETFFKVTRDLENRFKGKDCFKRANIWTYTLNKHYGVKSKKVFMHYTNKFNREIDDMGRSGAGALLGRMFSRNKGWDFHVAPAVTVNGVDYVLDPHLRKKAETTEQWVEFLTERGESRLKIRHRDLLKDLKRARKRLRRTIRNKNADYAMIADARSKVKEIEAKLKYLGLTEDPNQKIDIKCKKITHIMEFDANQDTQWCYYQEASMYYYATLELRKLNYGKMPGHDLRLPLTNTSLHTEEAFLNGYNYSYERFDRDQLEESLEEFRINEKPDTIYDL